MKTRTQKLLKPVSQGQPLCLEILTLMFSILARYQRMYNFTSMPKWRTVHKHTRRLRMQMQTWVYRKNCEKGEKITGHKLLFIAVVLAKKVTS